jgi:hypothetical protein
MSIKFFRAKAHDLEQAARKYQQAPSCGAEDQRDSEPDGEELLDEDEDEDEERDPDPAGDVQHDPGERRLMHAPIRLVIRERRRSAA